MIIRVLPTLFVIALITASCAQEEQERPWVFRSVLDGQPRMITAELDTNLFVAYDAGSGLFYKAWDGSVTLEGAVYTSVHGPQPTSTGTDYFVATPASVWTVYQHGEPQHVQAFYRGHKFEDGYVSFMTLLVVATGDFMRVEESPRARRDEKGNLGLERVYSMSSTNENLVAGITANAGSLLGRESYSVTGGGGATRRQR